MEVEGPRRLQREVAGWAGRHEFADVKPARA
jgi:hypothetical protein